MYHETQTKRKGTEYFKTAARECFVEMSSREVRDLSHREGEINRCLIGQEFKMVDEILPSDR